MIALEPAKRPSVKNLMKHPRISFVIRQLEVKRKETDVLRKQNDVTALEQAYKERCEKHESKVKQVEAKEASLKQLEERLQRREAALQQLRQARSGQQRAQELVSKTNAPHQVKAQARPDSTDRAIGRILDQHLNNVVVVEDVKKESERVSINFRMDPKSSLSHLSAAAPDPAEMPSSIHHQQ